jgi:hypothetical protein
MIVHRDSFILVRLRYYAALELGADGARAHRKGGHDPREEHKGTAD